MQWYFVKWDFFFYDMDFCKMYTQRRSNFCFIDHWIFIRNSHEHWISTWKKEEQWDIHKHFLVLTRRNRKFWNSTKPMSKILILYIFAQFVMHSLLETNMIIFKLIIMNIVCSSKNEMFLNIEHSAEISWAIYDSSGLDKNFFSFFFYLTASQVPTYRQ